MEQKKIFYWAKHIGIIRTEKNTIVYIQIQILLLSEI